MRSSAPGLTCFSRPTVAAVSCGSSRHQPSSGRVRTFKPADHDGTAGAVPPLTTVQIPREKLRAAACQLLHRMIAEEQGGVEEVMPTTLVVRASTTTARHG